MTEPKDSLRYRDAGVDIDAASAALKRVKGNIEATFNEHVLQDIGSFGAMYQPDLSAMQQPVLVSSVDGVGTKLKLAFMTGRHDTIGIDLVSHCVNDILVQGAKPLFFLDYLALGKLEEEVVAQVIRGLTVGCRYAGCALIGGETAEMPDMYNPGEYDVAGTIVGIVDRARIVDGERITPGDAVIGLPSSGLHTNGYSLARKICFERAGLGVDDPMPGVGRSVGDALLEPHVSYAKLMQIIMRLVDVRGMSHITGGGITDNLPRALPDGLGVEVDLGAWEALPIFKFLRDAGEVDEREMLHVFNMGIGFCFIVPASATQKAIEGVEMTGQQAWHIGTVNDTGKLTYTGAVRYAASH